MTTYQVVNPYNSEAGGVHPSANADDVARLVARAGAARIGPMRDRAVAERAALVHAVADLHAERKTELAHIIVREMGKPLVQAIGEVEFCEAIYRYYADNAEAFLRDEPIESAQGKAWIRKSPLGILLGIMPWNFPLYQIARFAAPNLVLGNPVLVKPAPQCPDSASALQQVIHSAGFDSGEYSTLLIDEEQVAHLIGDLRIQGVSLTGSERAGRSVGAVSGGNLKKTVLELGGSDPFIVLSADDLDATVAAAVFARIDNNGQVCNGAKRFIVVDELYDDFAERFCAGMAAIVPGDPMDERVELGPLSSVAAAQVLEEQVNRAVQHGASLRVGSGKREGAMFAPAVLEGITPENPAFSEEFFGPVAQLYRVRDEAEAVELANATPFGLGAFIFSADVDQAARVADRMDSGMVFINEVAAEAAELPFGGVKNSGTGRELGTLGIEEFMNRKLVKMP